MTADIVTLSEAYMNTGSALNTPDTDAGRAAMAAVAKALAGGASSTDELHDAIADALEKRGFKSPQRKQQPADTQDAAEDTEGEAETEEAEEREEEEAETAENEEAEEEALAVSKAELEGTAQQPAAAEATQQPAEATQQQQPAEAEATQQQPAEAEATQQLPAEAQATQQPAPAKEDAATEKDAASTEEAQVESTDDSGEEQASTEAYDEEQQEGAEEEEEDAYGYRVRKHTGHSTYKADDAEADSSLIRTRHHAAHSKEPEQPQPESKGKHEDDPHATDGLTYHPPVSRRASKRLKPYAGTLSLLHKPSDDDGEEEPPSKYGERYKEDAEDEYDPLKASQEEDEEYYQVPGTPRVKVGGGTRGLECHRRWLAGQHVREGPALPCWAFN
jgi:hypothetical protein